MKRLLTYIGIAAVGIVACVLVSRFVSDITGVREIGFLVGFMVALVFGHIAVAIALGRS